MNIGNPREDCVGWSMYFYSIEGGVLTYFKFHNSIQYEITLTTSNHQLCSTIKISKIMEITRILLFEMFKLDMQYYALFMSTVTFSITSKQQLYKLNY